MLEILFKKQAYIFKKIEKIAYERYFFDIVDFNEKLIGLIGAREGEQGQSFTFNFFIVKSFLNILLNYDTISL